MGTFEPDAPWARLHDTFLLFQTAGICACHRKTGSLQWVTSERRFNVTDCIQGMRDLSVTGCGVDAPPVVKRSYEHRSLLLIGMPIVQ